MLPITLILIIAFALLFDMTNGWNDAANAVATVISTRVLSPAKAIFFGAVLNFVGAWFSSKVARTVGSEIASEELLSRPGAMVMFLAAVMTAPIWITWCSKRGLPNSCSHALLGALIGAVIAFAGGVSGLRGHGIQMIFFGVLFAPIAGFLLGHLTARVVTFVGRRMKPGPAAATFGKLQLVSAGAMALAHGTGDAQKAMGIISGALMVYYNSMGIPTEFHIPIWVRLLCATAMGLGTTLGGWHVIRTLGSKLAHLRTYQGFAAETAGSMTIMALTLGGIPCSTTHSITGSIMGVGSVQGIRAVRWGIGKKIVFAWLVTFPLNIVAGGLMFLLLRAIGVH